MPATLNTLTVLLALISGVSMSFTTGFPVSPDKDSAAFAENTAPDLDPQPYTLFVPALFSGIVLTPDAYEPDDDHTSATPISSGDVQRHNILPEGDVDWLVFEVTAQSEVVIETAGAFYDLDTPIDWNTEIWLRRSDLGPEWYNNDFVDNYYSRINRECGSDPLDAGTYFIEIANGSGDYPDGSDILTVPKYDVTLSVSACP